MINQRSLLSMTAVGLIFSCATGIAKADETLKFRAVLHATFAQSQDVGDVDGHTMSLARYSGLTSFPDGTTGTGYFVATTDYIKGAGTFWVYNNLTLNDGSVLWYKSTGATTMDGTTSRFQGTVTVLGGKGKYEGAKGDGTVTGARTVPLSAGADLYNDLVINIKK